MKATRTTGGKWRWLKLAVAFVLGCCQVWAMGPAVGGMLANETFDLLGDER